MMDMRRIHRRYPDRFSMRLTLYHKGGGKAVEYSTVLSDEDRREVDKLVLKLMNARRRMGERVCVGRAGSSLTDDPFAGWCHCQNCTTRWHPCGFVGGCDWFDYGGVWFEYWTCGLHLGTEGFVERMLDAGDPNPCLRESNKR